MKVEQALRDAADILETNRFCRGTEAQDKQGHSINPNSSAAVAYCVVGAIIRAIGGHSSKEDVDLRTKASELVSEVAGEWITGYSDVRGRKKETVVKVLRQAADKAAERG